MYGPAMARGGNELPKRLSQKSAQKVLEANGWTRELGGKHVVKMTRAGHRPITLPACGRQDYAVGLTRAILKQAGLIPTGSPAGEEE